MAGKSMRLGISIYPDFCSSVEEIDEKLRLPGYSEVFTSMQLSDLGFDHAQAEVGEKTRYLYDQAKAQGKTVHADVSDAVFRRMKAAPDHLQVFAELGIPVLRIDAGFTGEQICQMTMNPLGIRIEDNLSDYAMVQEHWQMVKDHGNPAQYCVCHNFYPCPDTGLAFSEACEIARRFQAEGCETGAFIGSEVSPDDLFSGGHGVMTVEEHRWRPSAIQAAEFAAAGCFDFIFFGDSSPSGEELQQVRNAVHSVAEVITKEQKQLLDDRQWERLANQPVIDIPVYWENLSSDETRDLEGKIFCDRADHSAKMIRVTQTRGGFMKDPYCCVERKAGTITMANARCGHYSGEIQIVLEDLPASPLTNCVGRVRPYAEHLLAVVRAEKKLFRLKGE